MIDKKELYKQIDLIIYDVLDNVVSPICEIGKGIWADPFMADITCYTQHREDSDIKEKEIINTICKRYRVPSLQNGNHFIMETKVTETNEYIAPLKIYWSLASIALYIILNGKATQFHSHYKCDFCGKDTSTVQGPYDNLICLDCCEDFIKEQENEYKK